MRRSTRLTRGIRRRIVKVYALGFMGAILAGWVACLPVEAALHRGEMPFGEVFANVLGGVPTLILVFPVHLTPLGPWGFFAVSAATVLVWGAARIGLVHMYWERAAVADRKA
jgi:hypothetical protein